MTIEIGTWVLPMIVTIVGFFFIKHDETRGGYLGGFDFMGTITGLIWLAVSLAVWLIWALFD